MIEHPEETSKWHQKLRDAGLNTHPYFEASEAMCYLRSRSLPGKTKEVAHWYLNRKGMIGLARIAGLPHFSVDKLASDEEYGPESLKAELQKHY